MKLFHTPHPFYEGKVKDIWLRVKSIDSVAPSSDETGGSWLMLRGDINGLPVTESVEEVLAAIRDEEN